MVFLCILGALTSIRSPIITPYQSMETLLATTIKSASKEANLFEPTEFEIDIKATFDNPFDSSDISVRVEVREPDGKSFYVPG